MSHDTLSDVLRSVRLRSALFFYVSCRGKWAAEAPPSREIAAAVMPGADHVMEYHVVTEGECWAAIVGQAPLKLRQGDIILVPQGDPHVVHQLVSRNATSIPAVPRHLRQRRPAARRAAQPRPDGPSTTLVCGFIGCDCGPSIP